MRVGPSTPTVPTVSPSATTGANTTEHAANGSTPCSAPIATDRPRLSMSRTSETITYCCSSVCSTDRTISTASNASAIADAPPTNIVSSTRRDVIAFSTRCETSSTTPSPDSTSGPDSFSGVPTIIFDKCCDTRANTSSDISPASSIGSLSTTPFDITTTTVARREDRPTICTERTTAASAFGPTTTAA